MRMRAGCLLATALAGCGGTGFGLDLEVDPGCAGAAKTIVIFATARPTNATKMEEDDAARFFAGMHHVVVVPPDGSTGVLVQISARDAQERQVGEGIIEVPFAVAGVIAKQLVLSACGSDGGATDAAPDLAIDDLATPKPDLTSPPD